MKTTTIVKVLCNKCETKHLKKKLEDVRITYTAKDFFLNVENPYFKTKDGNV